MNKKNENYVCHSCILKLAIDNDLYIEMNDYDNSIIFSVRDENLKINGETLRFSFANKYEVEK